MVGLQDKTVTETIKKQKTLSLSSPSRSIKTNASMERGM